MNLLKTLSKQVRGPYEKCSATSFKSRLVLARYWAIAVVIERIVISDVKSGPGIRIPTEQKLSGKTPAERVVIHSGPNINKPCELIGRSSGNQIRVKGYSTVVVTSEAALCIV